MKEAIANADLSLLVDASCTRTVWDKDKLEQCLEATWFLSTEVFDYEKKAL